MKKKNAGKPRKKKKKSFTKEPDLAEISVLVETKGLTSETIRKQQKKTLL